MYWYLRIFDTDRQLTNTSRLRRASAARIKELRVIKVLNVIKFRHFKIGVQQNASVV